MQQQLQNDNSRFRKDKAIHLQVHLSDCLPCDIKGNTEQVTERLQSVLCEGTLLVKRKIVV